MPSTTTRAPIPKFASNRGAFRTSFEIGKDTSNSTILTLLFNPKFSAASYRAI